MHAFKSASELRHLLRIEKVTARDLLEEYLTRVDRYDVALNAIVWQDRAKARQVADAIEPGDPRPLAGIPMTVKEAFDLVGSPTTLGVPEMRNNIAKHDSVVVARLREAGANVFGKSNVPLGLSDLQSYNDIYGQTNNPWNVARTPGGSSGGSAAALAAGLTGLEMGSDVGGSIRNPAHYCGVFGHKPTWSLVPTRGHAQPPGVLIEPDIAVVGPMARSAADLDLALDVVAGPDVLASAVRYELPTLDGRRLKDLRVAVWATDEMSPVGTDALAAVSAVAQACKDAGATVDDSARPAFTSAESDSLYSRLILSFRGAVVPEPQFGQLRAEAHALAADDQSESAAMLRAQVLDHRDWVVLINERERLRWAWHAFFKEFDVVIAPIAGTAAFPHDHSPIEVRTILVDNQPRPYFDPLFWGGLFGVAFLPATAIPVTRNAEGLPLGVQIVGPAYGDRITIGVARLLEDAGFRFTPPPGYAT
jgi:amidase